MKKILTLIAFALIVFSASAKETEPTLVLEYYYTNKADSVYISNSIKSDESLCCSFVVVLKPSKTNGSETQIKHRETGIVLGTIYGTPTKEFLVFVQQNYLTEQYINDIVPRIVATKSSN